MILIEIAAAVVLVVAYRAARRRRLDAERLERRLSELCSGPD